MGETVLIPDQVANPMATNHLVLMGLMFPALEGVFGSRAAAAALVHLQETGESHPRQIAQRFGCSTLQIQKQLDKFEELGLLSSRVQGQYRLYHFAADRPMTAHLQTFLTALGTEPTQASTLGPLFDQTPTPRAQGTQGAQSPKTPKPSPRRRHSYVHEMDLGFINMLTPKERLDRSIDVLHDLFLLLRDEPGQSSKLEPLIQNLLQAALVFAEALGPVHPDWQERLGRDLYLNIAGPHRQEPSPDLDFWKDTPFWNHFRSRFHLRADLDDLPALQEVCEDLLAMARDLSGDKWPTATQVWRVDSLNRGWQH